MENENKPVTGFLSQWERIAQVAIGAGIWFESMYSYRKSGVDIFALSPGQLLLVGLPLVFAGILMYGVSIKQLVEIKDALMDIIKALTAAITALAGLVKEWKK